MRSRTFAAHGLLVYGPAKRPGTLLPSSRDVSRCSLGPQPARPPHRIAAIALLVNMARTIIDNMEPDARKEWRETLKKKTDAAAR